MSVSDRDAPEGFHLTIAPVFTAFADHSNALLGL
jgi:hypothetical protein